MTKEIKRLQDVQGIGKGVSQKLIEHFQDENSALKALEETNISAISEIEGFGEKMATRLVRSYHSALTGENLTDFLRTPDSLTIYNKIISLLQQYGVTTYSKARALLLTPLPNNKLEIIKSRQKFAINSHKLTSYLANNLPEIDAQLKNVGPLKDTYKKVDIGARALFTTSKLVYDRLNDSPARNHCQIIQLNSLEEFREESLSYDEVILFSDYTIEDESESFIIFPEETSKTYTKFLPELILALFADNYQRIKAMLTLVDLLEIPEDLPFSPYIKSLERKDIDEFKKFFDMLKDNGEVDETIDPELNRLSDILKYINVVLSETEIRINESISDHLRQSSVELKGEKLLQLLREQDELGQPRDVREFLDDSIYEYIEELLGKEEQKIIDTLKLNEESDLVEGIFPRQITIPLEIDDNRKDLLLNLLRKKFKVRSIENKVKIASKLQHYKEMCFKLVREILEIDYALMIGKFGVRFDTIAPELRKDKKGLIIDQGYNIDLLNDQIKRNNMPDPIDYEIGNLGSLKDRVVLLSGANSGGKTTLLMMIAQQVIIAQMGLETPVKGNMILGLFDELYYYRKSSGNLDAGAFESTLKVLSNMIMAKEKSRLVLADEMESISEPGASARVISAYLDLLQDEPNSCGIFVSHLAQQISNSCKQKIRIDGIEATGLDKDLQLIVNRSPKYNYYARSTPQLIVERLVALSKGREKSIYEEILSRLKTK